MKSFLSTTFLLIVITMTVSESVKEWRQGDNGRTRRAPNCVFRILQMDPEIGPALSPAPVFLFTLSEKCGETTSLTPLKMA
jgi:hypothetical protein